MLFKRVKVLWLPILIGISSIKLWAADYMSPAALVSDTEDTAYVASHDAMQIQRIALATGAVDGMLQLERKPSALLLSPDSSTLYASVGGPDGEVLIIDPKSLSITGRHSAGHTPSGMALHDEKGILVVCNRFNNEVALLNLGSGDAVRVPVRREPIVAAVSQKTHHAFIANYLPHTAASEYTVAASVSVVDLNTSELVTHIDLPDGSNAIHGIAVSPDERFVFLTHTLARYHLPTTQLERGWMNTSALSAIHIPTQKLVGTVLLDDVELGFANPWAVQVSADSKYLCVTSAGASELSIIDYAAFVDKLAEARTSESDATMDLNFMRDIRRRIKLNGDGARSMVLHEGMAWIGQYFSDTLDVVHLEDELVTTVRLGPTPTPDLARQGEILFYSAKECFQQWQSCTSCHPSSRVDGLNWDLLNDGIGNPKNTKSLLLSHQTAPAMSTGIRKDAETAVRAGIKHIQFSALREDDALAIDAYLKSMKPLPSPTLVNGELSPAAILGKQVFEEAKCSKCHEPPLYTNRKQYNVHTGKGMDEDREFDVPTLVEVWRSAPYLHDGRAATLLEVFDSHSKPGTFGENGQFSDEDKANLVQYLLTL